MQTDWLDLIHWKSVLAGVAIGALTPVVATLAALALGWNSGGPAILALTLLAVLGGGMVAAMGAEEINGRLLNSLFVALICASLSFIASVAANPQTGTNIAGILFLVASYGATGALGGILSKPAYGLWRG